MRLYKALVPLLGLRFFFVLKKFSATQKKEFGIKLK